MLKAKVQASGEFVKCRPLSSAFPTMNLEYMIDADAVIYHVAKNLGIPRRLLRTKKQAVAFRKRSLAAKLGWQRRNRNQTP